MHDRVRIRFWLESGLALLGTVLALVTIVYKTWIESVFGVDPDQSSGAAEWLIVVACLALAVTAAILARQEWRRREPSAA